MLNQCEYWFIVKILGMVVIISRVSLVILVVRMFLYRLASKNSVVFYAFLALWFNLPPVYFKFLVFVNRGFMRIGLKAPSYYFLVYFYKSFIYSFVLALPGITKKEFLFGNHGLSVSGFELFKLLFWAVNGFWWLVFRKCFSGFSIALLLYLVC